MTSLCIGYGTQVTAKAHWPLVYKIIHYILFCNKSFFLLINCSFKICMAMVLSFLQQWKDYFSILDRCPVFNVGANKLDTTSCSQNRCPPYNYRSNDIHVGMNMYTVAMISIPVYTFYSWMVHSPCLENYLSHGLSNFLKFVFLLIVKIMFLIDEQCF